MPEFIDNIPVYEAQMDDEKFGHGVSFISLVKSPATEQPVFTFSKQSKSSIITDRFSFANADKKRGLITGVVMLADHPILRRVNGNDFYITFPPSVVEKMAFKFMKNLYGRNINKEHNPGDTTNKAYVVESWLFDESRGASLPSYMDPEKVKPGSWIATLKSEDENIINAIESGEIVGYSLEGDFGLKTDFSTDLQKFKKSIILDPELSTSVKIGYLKEVINGRG